jgi:hypothetical protein
MRHDRRPWAIRERRLKVLAFGDPPSAGLSTFVLAFGTIAAGSSIVATITLLDANSNPLVGVSPTVSVAPSVGIIITGSGVTNGSGVTTRTINTNGFAVGTGLTATCVARGVTLTTQPTFDVTVQTVSAANSVVTASPATVATGENSTVTVTVLDAGSTPIANASVTIASTGTGNTLGQPASVTDVNGVATGTIQSSVAEAKTVSATAAGTGITDTAPVTVGAATGTMWSDIWTDIWADIWATA